MGAPQGLLRGARTLSADSNWVESPQSPEYDTTAEVLLLLEGGLRALQGTAGRLPNRKQATAIKVQLAGVIDGLRGMRAP